MQPIDSILVSQLLLDHEQRLQELERLRQEVERLKDRIVELEVAVALAVVEENE